MSLIAAGIIGGLASAGAGIASSLMGANAQEKANQKNEALQREQWERDDNAYQRMVQDMNSAGLNPLSQASSPVSSALNTQQQPVDYSGISSSVGQGISTAINGLMVQKQMDLQNKMIGLNAIKSGISPEQLNQFTDDDLLNAYRTLVISNAKDAKKNADDESGRYTSSIGKATNDILSILSGSNNRVNDLNNKIGNVKLLDSKSVHSAKYKDTSTRREEDSYSKRTEEYYYNSAHKNNNSVGRSFGNWLRAKVFKK